jgi:adenine phosphoribosyltransferase
LTQDVDIKALIRTVPDFPKPGVLFRDITTLLKNAGGFDAVVNKLGTAYREHPIDKIAAIESRGFIIGARAGVQAQCWIRASAQGWETARRELCHDYALEYGPAGWRCTETGYSVTSACFSSTT